MVLKKIIENLVMTLQMQTSKFFYIMKQAQKILQS